MTFRNACCFFFCVIIWAMPSMAGAQQLSFIHIQTENNQFYEVQWNGKTYTSSPTGYLVVPQVPAGSHSLTISFSAETVARYTFTIEMADKPRGFSLRQSIDNSWTLFDMVDFSLLKGTIVEPAPKESIIHNPPDPALKPVTEEKVADKSVVIAVVKTEPLIIKKEKTTIKPTGILKIFDKSSSSGVDQVYVLINGTRLDTIALFIPILNEDQHRSVSNPSALIIRVQQSILEQEIISLNAGLIRKRQRYPLLSK